MNPDFDPQVRMIPIKQIQVLNPRSRGKNKFDQIMSNISKLGLKKPVTVAYDESSNGQPRYFLVCGQGRLEAYTALGEELIPAIITKGSRDRLLLMSLVENLARRQHSTIELVRNVADLKSRGYSQSEIAAKTDLTVAYVRAILQLLAKGDERLLKAVEKGQIPVNVAMTIATSDDKSVQRALTEAYESRNLRGRALLRARRLIDERRNQGKALRGTPRNSDTKPMSADSLLKTYQRETNRQRLLIQKAKLSETRLLFAESALRQLFMDENFVNVLRSEGLDIVPQYLASKIYQAEEVQS